MTRPDYGGGASRRGWGRVPLTLLPWARRDVYDERVGFVALTGLTLVLGLLSPYVGADMLPPAVMVVPLLLGGVVLGPRLLRLLLVVVVTLFAYDVARLGWMAVRPAVLVVVAVAVVIAGVLARGREVLGVSSARSESMLVELRDRLRLQGEVPRLPPGWNAEVAQRWAGGGSFGGDFVVSSLTGGGRCLELAVVDVSGKGVDAGTRALLLSGAFGGLLGAVPPEAFLPAANTYLLRQAWHEGFATAAHVWVDLTSGAYRLSSAGHPPVANLDAGSGKWRLAGVEGPMLGLVPRPEFLCEEGFLEPQDALLLYTDGMVEMPGRDLAVGIDKLLGEAERLVPRGFTGGAGLLINRAAPRSSDDRAVVLVWRS